ncbi:hypothetical protein MKY96_33835 [Paenibacillus sp. FSL R7-0302]|uniref:hypothetical protein n=1 Tax=Paenibacillus sp. FSL R7-0302 TaxID=2921681 RepID=UPI0030FB9C8F
MAKIDMSLLFKGKRKYITIGAIALVAVLGIYQAKSSGGGGGTGLRPIDPGPAPGSSGGSGTPGVTLSDIQSAISDYAQQDQASTQKQFESLQKGTMSAIESLTSGFNTAMESQSSQFTKAMESQSTQLNKALTDQAGQYGSTIKQLTEYTDKMFDTFTGQLTTIQDHNTKNYASLNDKLASSLGAMTSAYETKFNQLNNQLALSNDRLTQYQQQSQTALDRAVQDALASRSSGGGGSFSNNPVSSSSQSIQGYVTGPSTVVQSNGYVQTYYTEASGNTYQTTDMATQRANYDKVNTNNTPEQQAAIDYNRNRMDQIAAAAKGKVLVNGQWVTKP